MKCNLFVACLCSRRMVRADNGLPLVLSRLQDLRAGKTSQCDPLDASFFRPVPPLA